MSQNYENGVLIQQDPKCNPDKLILSSIQDARVYQAPVFEQEGQRLYMNENLFGPSPNCLEALSSLSKSNLALYSYGGDYHLKDTIANLLNISVDEIIINNGAASMIHQIIQSFIGEGDTALIPKPGWGYYQGVIETNGGRTEYYSFIEKEDQFLFNIDGLISKIEEVNPKLLIITSPNMPTGNIISYADLSKIASSLKNGVLLLDEAYYGFSSEVLSVSKLLKKHPNIIFIRTFSKLYGLANARVGVAFCQKSLCNLIQKISPLFGISGISQAVAIAALKDQDYYKNISHSICTIRDWFLEEVNSIPGFRGYQSHSNFVLLRTDIYSSDQIEDICRKNGYLIRNCKSYGLKNYIRITIGKESQMHDIIQILRNANYRLYNE